MARHKGLHGSPKKQRLDKGSVNVETIKTLLAEQAAQINETQRHHTADMMQGLRKDLEQHKEELCH